jgi:hypothetical protein
MYIMCGTVFAFEPMITHTVNGIDNSP